MCEQAQLFANFQLLIQKMLQEAKSNPTKQKYDQLMISLKINQDLDLLYNIILGCDMIQQDKLIMYQLQMDNQKKLGISMALMNRNPSRDSLTKRQVLTKTCKLYLNKYQQIKRNIDSKTKYIDDMKSKKLKLEQKNTKGNHEVKYTEYKAQIVNNKENIQQFFNVYKEEHGEELKLLEEKQELQNSLAKLHLKEKQTRKRINKIECQRKENKQTAKFNFKVAKHQQQLNESRLKLLQKELEINQYCSNKKIKNLRYYICQFGKQYDLSVLEDLVICQSQKVDLLSNYIKNQPIYINFKRQVGQFLDMYKGLQQIVEKKPILPHKILQLNIKEEQLEAELKQIMGNIACSKSALQKKAQQIQQLASKQIKLNLKTILQQNQNNPGNIVKQAKIAAIQQRRRVNSVKQKLGEIRYISDCLENIKFVQNNRQSLIQQRDSLSKIISLEQSKLRNQIQTKGEIQQCLDNIITDRNIFKEKPIKKSKRFSMVDLHESSDKEKEEPTFRQQNNYLLKGSSSQHLLPHFRTVSQLTTALNSDNISRESRLVSLSETQRKLPITHSLNKKTMQDLIMSRITRKTMRR